MKTKSASFVSLVTLASLVSLNAVVVGCGQKSSSGAANSTDSSVQTAMQSFSNRCGTIAARADHSLEEGAQVFTQQGTSARRFVQIQGEALKKVVKLMMSGEKILCLSATWQSDDLPVVSNPARVSVPDFHDSKASIKDGLYALARCKETQSGKLIFGLDIKVSGGKAVSLRSIAVAHPVATFDGLIVGGVALASNGNLVDINGKVTIASGEERPEITRDATGLILRKASNEVILQYALEGVAGKTGTWGFNSCSFSNLSLLPLSTSKN